jgi:hypothetical protein
MSDMVAALQAVGGSGYGHQQGYGRGGQNRNWEWRGQQHGGGQHARGDGKRAEPTEKKTASKCGFCKKYGHLEEDCRKKAGYVAAKATVPNAPPLTDAGSQVAWGKPLAWICISCNAEHWQEKALKCQSCKHPRAMGEKAPEEQMKKEQLRYKKEVEETLGQLSAAGAADQYPMTANDTKAEETYLKEHKYWLALIDHGGPDSKEVAAQKVKVEAAQRARPDPNRHLRDQACLATGLKDLHSNYGKVKLQEDEKFKKLATKQKATQEGFSERNKAAKEAYESTLAVLAAEYATHTALHAKEYEKLEDQRKTLAAAYEEKVLQCQKGLQQAAGVGRPGGEIAPVAANVMPLATITPAEVTEGRLIAGMSADPTLAAMAPEMQAMMSTFFINFCNTHCLRPGGLGPSGSGVQAQAPLPTAAATSDAAKGMDVDQMTDDSDDGGEESEVAALNGDKVKKRNKTRITKEEKKQKKAGGVIKGSK